MAQGRGLDSPVVPVAAASVPVGVKKMESDSGEVSPLAAMVAGARAVAMAPLWTRAAVGALFLLTLAMLPYGRSGPDDGGSLLAPLTVDSGALFRTRKGADFFSVYDAGARLLAGRDPYGVNTDTGKEGLRAPYVATFRYLPIAAALLAAPLNILPPWPAFHAWTALGVAMVVVNFLLCCGRRPDRVALMAMIWFAWFPAIAEFHMGQFTLAMATLMLWGVDALRSGRAWGAWAWAGAVVIKVYPIAMAPSLFLWGRRGSVAATVLVVVGSTLAWRAFVPSAMEEGLVNRGIAGRIVGTSRVPYAGAMGVQAMTGAAAWRAMGRGMNPAAEYDAIPAMRDAAAWANAAVLAAFAGACAWALWRTRRAYSLEALALFWLAWFYAYVDCWEHHYLLMQALLGLLVAWRVIDWRVALVCWASAGAPSMWWLWQRSGYSGNAVAEALGMMYFLQRPVSVLLLTVVLLRRIARGTSS